MFLRERVGRPIYLMVYSFGGFDLPIAHVHPTESEDFENLVKREKRSLDEFEISATPEQPVTREANVISPVSGSITIKSKKTGQSRTYRTGHMSGWVMEAYGDVKAGVL